MINKFKSVNVFLVMIFQTLLWALIDIPCDMSYLIGCETVSVILYTTVINEWFLCNPRRPDESWGGPSHRAYARSLKDSCRELFIRIDLELGQFMLLHWRCLIYITCCLRFKITMMQVQNAFTKHLFVFTRKAN